MNYDNIIVLGNSGVGKSTLINAFLGENKAQTRFGIEGTTKELGIYESDKLPFRLIDTVGFEPSAIKLPFTKEKAVKAVEKWANKNVEAGRSDTKINLIWFCVDGTSGKLFIETLYSFEKATRIWKSSPIIIVITKSYSEPDKAKNLQMIEEAFAKNKKLRERVKAVIPVVAETFIISEENNTYAPVSGIVELLDKTNELMPDGRKAAEKDFKEFKLSRLRIQANTIVGISSAFAATVAAVPLPIPDAGVLTAIETLEINQIARTFGIKDDEKSKLFVKQLVTAGTVGAFAKAALTALKATPLNVGAAALNAIIATTITAMLGEVSIIAFEQIYLGKKSLDDIDWIKKLLESKNINDVVEKINSIAKNLESTDDIKKIPKIILDSIFTDNNKKEE